MTPNNDAQEIFSNLRKAFVSTGLIGDLHLTKMSGSESVFGGGVYVVGMTGKISNTKTAQQFAELLNDKYNENSYCNGSRF